MVSFSNFKLPMLQIVADRFNLLHATDSAQRLLQSVSNCCNPLQTRTGVTYHPVCRCAASSFSSIWVPEDNVLSRKIERQPTSDTSSETDALQHVSSKLRNLRIVRSSGIA